MDERSANKNLKKEKPATRICRFGAAQKLQPWKVLHYTCVTLGNRDMGEMGRLTQMLGKNSYFFRL